MAIEEREVYEHAPVVLAVIEIRHPLMGDLTPSSVAHIKRELSDQTPLLREAHVASIEFNVGKITVPQQALGVQPAPRFVSRDGATAVTFRREAVVVETSRYDHFERLRDLALSALRARQGTDPVDGVDRVGVRYVDEVRVPNVGPEIEAWDGWVHDALLAPAALGLGLGLTPRQMQGLIAFDVKPGQTLVLRHGPGVGYAVDPGWDLIRTTSPPGAFYLFDIDSSWTATDETPPADEDRLRATCDSLHAPVHDLFESLITDRLRREVLRRND